MGQAPPPAAEWIELGEGDLVRLHATRCHDCGAYSFPPRDACPRCTNMNLEPTRLGPYARLHSYTVIEPILAGRQLAVGQVRFDEGPIVRCYVEDAGGELELDGAVELVRYVLPATDRLEATTTFALRARRTGETRDA